jgi:hypothetical protein
MQITASFQLNPKPNVTIERPTPIVAINEDNKPHFAMVISLTCKAPANNKRPSMPSNRASENSNSNTWAQICYSTVNVGNRASVAITAKEAMSATSQVLVEDGAQEQIINCAKGSSKNNQQ